MSNKPHVHILGICGTFMGGIALLAKARGYRVTGSDTNVYPPMSTQLEEAGITLMEGYAPEHLDPEPDWVVVGNALSRGNPAVEYMLERGLAYTSGPQWLAEHLLKDAWVLAVAGTHGKTTTSSMLAWVLEYAGLQPGFLIGGVPLDFGVSARSGGGTFFVVEADEYDTAFFDKRSKFVHYRPRTLVMNNLEFDHADIFDSLADIQKQFHHLVRTVPGNGLIVRPSQDDNLTEVLDKGCWTPQETLAAHGENDALWSADNISADCSEFDVLCAGESVGRLCWEQTGLHSLHNALAAIAAARHSGIPAAVAVEALCQFKGVKRRMELRGEVNGVRVYDDFAHHPTAIETTLQGLRARVGESRILAVLEPRSNTMRMGVHQDSLAPSLAAADQVWLYAPEELGWDASQVIDGLQNPGEAIGSIEQIVAEVSAQAKEGDHVLVMSNGGFGGIHQRLLDALETAS